ncbi:hypothetical protein BXZ70DRAFT_909569 [Cristinia sonorae]|uniref:WW domain-containing protein n=1 Tax=Cristinia sonorae TaxID=1940300 RepID=A0A8K0XLY4_9AGAR|nr:hypothetical protein BXZ70DRAFT_909569 [Cristinia sonorae]
MVPPNPFIITSTLTLSPQPTPKLPTEPTDWRITATSPGNRDPSFYNTVTKQSTWYTPKGYSAKDVMRIPGADTFFENESAVVTFMKELETLTEKYGDLDKGSTIASLHAQTTDIDFEKENDAGALLYGSKGLRNNRTLGSQTRSCCRRCLRFHLVASVVESTGSIKVKHTLFHKLSLETFAYPQQNPLFRLSAIVEAYCSLRGDTRPSQVDRR